MKYTREIGGYFGLEQLIHREYYSNLIALNNARNALVYLLKARNIQKLYLPFFLCDSVSSVCARENCAYEYYHIDKDFLPVFKKTLEDGEYLYVVNFYGQVSNERIVELKEIYKNIIFDNVQAFFQKPIAGIDTIYSCRKFFGVPDGGYLSTDVRLNERIVTDVSKDRMKHILGRFEGCAGEYYADFKANDHSFVDLELKEMSALTHNILGAVDYDYVRKQRNSNYRLLDSVLGNMNLLSLVEPDGPYCYPFYCKNGMSVKRKLAQNKIFVATLWPNVLDLNDSLEKDYAENILPLPCDQRYIDEDMNVVIELILACMSERK